jgi:hypothetical protein
VPRGRGIGIEIVIAAPQQAAPNHLSDEAAAMVIPDLGLSLHESAEQIEVISNCEGSRIPWHDGSGIRECRALVPIEFLENSLRCAVREAVYVLATAIWVDWGKWDGCRL